MYILNIKISFIINIRYAFIQKLKIFFFNPKLVIWRIRKFCETIFVEIWTQLLLCTNHYKKKQHNIYILINDLLKNNVCPIKNYYSLLWWNYIIFIYTYMSVVVGSVVYTYWLLPHRSSQFLFYFKNNLIFFHSTET